MDYFITGTDTGVGKTYVTKLLIEAFRGEGIHMGGYKPIACGDREDAQVLAGACEETDLDLINPLFFQAPLAPYAAALVQGSSIDTNHCLDGFRAIKQKYQHVLVEGAGGWEVPITENYRFSDLALDLGLPVIVVAENRLGALNHCLLTVEAIQRKGLTCAGIILNALVDEMDTAMITNQGVMESLAKVPLLANVIHNQHFIDIDELLKR